MPSLGVKLKLKELGRKKGFYLGDQKLKEREVRVHLRTTNSPAYPMFNKYRRQSFWGYYYSGLGAAIAAGFLIYDQTEGAHTELTLIGMGMGIAVMIPGIVYLLKAINTYDSFIELYNPDGYTKLGLGPTENGFGLVLNF